MLTRDKNINNTNVSYVATRANDGSFANPSCTVTKQNISWWVVDLESPAIIDHVNVTNDRNYEECNYR